MAITSNTMDGKIKKAQDPDVELIEQAKRGNHEAFNKLVKRYEPLVYKFSYKVCQDKENAEETMQNTFVNVFRKLKQFDGKSKFTTWLYSIVTNNCKMKRRRTKLEQASVSLEGTHLPRHLDGYDNETIRVWSETPLDVAMNKELQERLDKAILKLPLEYRLVFILRDIEGQSAKETASIMKLSVAAVKSRLRRARLFLREQLHDYVSV